MIDKQQIQELKKAFDLMDMNHDEVVDAEDLKAILEYLG